MHTPNYGLTPLPTKLVQVLDLPATVEEIHKRGKLFTSATKEEVLELRKYVNYYHSSYRLIQTIIFDTKRTRRVGAALVLVPKGEFNEITVPEDSPGLFALDADSNVTNEPSSGGDCSARPGS
jgi:hypothetical protein